VFSSSHGFVAFIIAATTLLFRTICMISIVSNRNACYNYHNAFHLFFLYKTIRCHYCRKSRYTSLIGVTVTERPVYDESVEDKSLTKYEVVKMY
jgi:hypothetical protein